MTNIQNHHNLFYCRDQKVERASAAASRGKENRQMFCFTGSVTVEAAFAVPLFFFAVVCLLYLMEIMSVQTAVRCGLQEAGKRTAEDTCEICMINPAHVEQYVVDSIGADRLDRSIVVDGSSGISCAKSTMSAFTGIGQLTASYKIRLPVPYFGLPDLSYEETMRIKAWNGYVKGGLFAEKDEIVYVTETGLVYHKDYHCTHLDLSIRAVPASQVPDLRNDGGGKYRPCVHCGKKSGDVVYITDTGDRYHSSLSCSGLKRTIYAVPLSEVVGKGACSRCGQ